MSLRKLAQALAVIGLVMASGSFANAASPFGLHVMDDSNFAGPPGWREFCTGPQSQSLCNRSRSEAGQQVSRRELALLSEVNARVNAAITPVYEGCRRGSLGLFASRGRLR
ncbi:MAG: hypothetical protein R3C97_06310 [Geminicoccaceae bacterium]